MADGMAPALLDFLADVQGSGQLPYTNTAIRKPAMPLPLPLIPVTLRPAPNNRAELITTAYSRRG
jgi:hypothetical protein